MRAFYYMTNGNYVQAKRSISFDLADFIPTRIIFNILRGVNDANYDLDEGIWIG